MKEGCLKNNNNNNNNNNNKREREKQKQKTEEQLFGSGESNNVDMKIIYNYVLLTLISRHT